MYPGKIQWVGEGEVEPIEAIVTLYHAGLVYSEQESL